MRARFPSGRFVTHNATIFPFLRVRASHTFLRGAVRRGATPPARRPPIKGMLRLPRRWRSGPARRRKGPLFPYVYIYTRGARVRRLLRPPYGKSYSARGLQLRKKTRRGEEGREGEQTASLTKNLRFVSPSRARSHRKTIIPRHRSSSRSVFSSPLSAARSLLDLYGGKKSRLEFRCARLSRPCVHPPYRLLGPRRVISEHASRFSGPASLPSHLSKISAFLPTVIFAALSVLFFRPLSRNTFLLL